MGNKNEGLHKKFNVSRVDGKNPDSMYFVLDMDNDPIARQAAAYYAYLAGRAGYFQLSKDMQDYLDKNPIKHKEPTSEPAPETL